MASSNIDDLYYIFKEKGITAESLWTLTDEILTKNLQLTPLQKLRYNAAKSKQFKGKNMH